MAPLDIPLDMFIRRSPLDVTPFERERTFFNQVHASPDQPRESRKAANGTLGGIEFRGSGNVQYPRQNLTVPGPLPGFCIFERLIRKCCWTDTKRRRHLAKQKQTISKVYVQYIVCFSECFPEL